MHIAPTGYTDEALRAPTAAVLDVAGGAIVVDVTGTDTTPASLLTEPYWAQSWVAGVYGQEVADRPGAVRGPGFTGPAQIDAAAGFLTQRVHRIGRGYWLHRWWPTEPSRLPELDAWLLELELGASRGWRRPASSRPTRSSHS